ncbi:6-carboxytetrahydropterin synthase QueD [Candidatus Omnitrophota bacterium]
MYSVRVEGDFSSAHNLREYKGKCEELHGHNWKVEVKVCKEKLDPCGMVMDFTELKSCLNKVLEKLDHKHLNNIQYFKKVNPTSENIAKYIFDNLLADLAGISSVTVWESRNSRATYAR